MIHCRICQRDHDDAVAVCDCGADLAVDGIAIGGASSGVGFEPAGSMADLEGLPELPSLASLIDSAAAPESDVVESLPPPPLTSQAEPVREPPVVELGERSAVSFDAEPDAPEIADGVPVKQRRSFAVQPSDDPSRVPAPPPQPVVAPSEPPPVPVAPIGPEIDQVPVPVPAGGVDAAAVTEEVPVAVPAPGDGFDAATPTAVQPRVSDLGAGETTCPSCGQIVPPGRRFCRCGVQQEEPRLTTETADTGPPPQTMWRRLTGTGVGRGGDHRTWGQKAKDIGVHRSMRYATRMSSRTRLGRIALGLLGGGGLVLLIGPLRQQAKDLPDLLQAKSLTEITGWSPGECDGPAKDVPENPWLTGWPASGEAPAIAAAGCPAVLDLIEGSFSTPTDVSRVTIQIGQTSGQTEINRRQPVMSPAALRFEFVRDGAGEPTVVEVSLKDTAAIQEFEAGASNATSFSIEVIDVHDHTWPELEMVQIAQVAFFEK